MADRPEIPPITPRPRIALWLFERDMDYNEGAAFFGTDRETMRRICKPFADEQRRVPNPELMAEIVARSDGELQPNHFYATTVELQDAA